MGKSTNVREPLKLNKAVLEYMYIEVKCVPDRLAVNGDLAKVYTCSLQSSDKSWPHLLGTNQLPGGINQ